MSKKTGKRKGDRGASPAKIEARRLRRIVDVAATAGLPEAQRDPGALVIEATVIDDQPRPIRETVRKLTRVEKLLRSGVLEKHEAVACEWYAAVHAMAFDTVGCTANYDVGGGGHPGSGDLLARYASQGEARADYHLACEYVPSEYRALFEAIVCRNEAISGVAKAMFDKGRSQREALARATLKLCANRLYAGLGPLLPAC